MKKDIIFFTTVGHPYLLNPSTIFTLKRVFKREGGVSKGGC